MVRSMKKRRNKEQVPEGAIEKRAAVVQKLIDLSKEDPEFGNLVNEFIKFRDNKQKEIPAAEKEAKKMADEKDAYDNRKLLLKEREMEKAHLEAETKDITELRKQDWTQYSGPWIKDDHLCTLMGNTFVPFGPRSKTHLEIDIIRAKGKIAVIDNFIVELNKLIKEYEEKEEKSKKEEKKEPPGE